MAEFAYNNTKNDGTGYIFFKLNCVYYLRVFCKKDLDLHSNLKTTKKLSFKLQNFMAIYK